MPKVDSEFEEITAGEEEEDCQQKLKTKWASVDALVGREKRMRVIAESGNGLQGSDRSLTSLWKTVEYAARLLAVPMD